MADKFWSLSGSGKVENSAEYTGKLRCTMTITAQPSDRDKPTVFVKEMGFDDVERVQWEQFVKEAWAKPLAEMTKHGVTFDGDLMSAFTFSGANIPSGKFRKIERLLVEGGLIGALEFGKKHAKKKGYTTEDDK